MKKVIVLFFLINSLNVFAQAINDNLHIGRWKGVNHTGDSLILNIDNCNNYVLNLKNRKTVAFSIAKMDKIQNVISNRIFFNYKTKPITFEIISFENDAISFGKTEGQAIFIKPNTMKLSILEPLFDKGKNYFDPETMVIYTKIEND